MHIKEFKISENLTLKLEKGKTVIYVNGRVFRQCRYLLLNLNDRETNHTNNLKSIDEVADYLINDLRLIKNDSKSLVIPPETEFWGHCSNLQVWYENNYNTKLIHSNLAFPLLRKLTEVGDILAKRVFKEEIISRYNTGVESVRTFLKDNKYLSFLTNDELYSLLDTEYEIIKELEIVTDKDWLNVDIKNGKVIGVTHHGLKLTQVPYPIRRLANLERLDLRSNLIKEIPEWIGELQTIKKLYLTNNQLIKLPNSIGNLKDLEILKIHFNELTNLPKSFGNLSSLRKANLSRNLLKELPNSMGDLTKLEELDLRDNNLEKIPESVGNLKNLKSLVLNRNNLVSIPETFGNLCSIKILCINKNHLNDLPINLKNLAELEILDIGNNDFSSLRKPFDSLTSLKEIFLEGNPLKGLPGFVYKLPKLHLINIMSTNINKFGIMKKSLKKEIEIYR